MNNTTVGIGVHGVSGDVGGLIASNYTSVADFLYEVVKITWQKCGSTQMAMIATLVLSVTKWFLYVYKPQYDKKFSQIVQAAAILIGSVTHLHFEATILLAGGWNQMMGNVKDIALGVYGWAIDFGLGWIIIVIVLIAIHVYLGTYQDFKTGVVILILSIFVNPVLPILLFYDGFINIYNLRTSMMFVRQATLNNPACMRANTTSLIKTILPFICMAVLILVFTLVMNVMEADIWGHLVVRWSQTHCGLDGFYDFNHPLGLWSTVLGLIIYPIAVMHMMMEIIENSVKIPSRLINALNQVFRGVIIYFLFYNFCIATCMHIYQQLGLMLYRFVCTPQSTGGYIVFNDDVDDDSDV